MKKAILAMAAFLTAIAAAFAGAPATARLGIEGMTCGGCATAVTMVLKKTPGVITATVSY
jgi:hypothetical protein